MIGLLDDQLKMSITDGDVLVVLGYGTLDDDSANPILHDYVEGMQLSIL